MRQLNRPLAAITLGVLAACAQNPSVRPIGFPPQGLASSDDELAASLSGFAYAILRTTWRAGT